MTACVGVSRELQSSKKMHNWTITIKGNAGEEGVSPAVRNSLKHHAQGLIQSLCALGHTETTAILETTRIRVEAISLDTPELVKKVQFQPDPQPVPVKQSQPVRRPDGADGIKARVERRLHPEPLRGVDALKVEPED